MALGQIARQLAQQAVLDQVAPKPSAPPQPESVGAVMLGEIQAMQKACKDDEELVVLFKFGAGTIRVLEFIVPTWQVLVLSGLDDAKNVTRVVSVPESIQLVCKVLKAPAGAKPTRLGFRIPKAK